LVEAPYDGVVQKDMDGASPFTLFIENMDVAASLRTRFGSKNANVRFVAVAAGSGGNSITVAIIAGPSQAFGVSVVGNDVSINLGCDAGGRPNQFVSDIIDLLNADVSFAAILRASRALGSDGSAAMEIPDEANAPTVVMAQTNLSNGADATDLAGVTIEVSPTGAPEFAGPWFAVSAAEAAFGAPYGLGAGTIGAYTFEVMVKGLRVTLEPGAYASSPVVTAIVRKKGGA
jgi:hypothetical protein